MTLADGASTVAGGIAVGRRQGRRQHGHHQRGRHLPAQRHACPTARWWSPPARKTWCASSWTAARPQQFHRFPVRGPERQRGHRLPRGRHHQHPRATPPTTRTRATDSPNAALYSMADLTIAGTGSLTVNGQLQRRHRLQGRPGAGRRQRHRGRRGRRHPGQGLHRPAGRRLPGHRRRRRREVGQRGRRGPRLAPGQRRNPDRQRPATTASRPSATLTVAGGTVTVDRIRRGPRSRSTSRRQRRHGQRHRQRRRRERLGRQLQHHPDRRPRRRHGRRRNGRRRDAWATTPWTSAAAR